MLKKIKRAKYKEVTETEERISLPLQTMCGAIFDAILFYIVTSASGGKWQDLRHEMCKALNLKKTDTILSILKNTYGDSDAIFLQEVASQFISQIERDPAFKDFSVISPRKLGARDQNSVILLNRGLFEPRSVEEVSDKVEANFGGASVPVAAGDILAIKVKDRHEQNFFFASFHGDTNGAACTRRRV